LNYIAVHLKKVAFFFVIIEIDGKGVFKNMYICSIAAEVTETYFVTFRRGMLTSPFL
jgi:presenilin-like A22 family membrane protease